MTEAQTNKYMYEYTTKIIDIVKYVLEKGRKTYFQSDFVQTLKFTIFHLDHSLTVEITRQIRFDKLDISLQLDRDDEFVNEVYFTCSEFSFDNLEVASMSMLRDIKSSRRFSYLNIPEIPLRCEL